MPASSTPPAAARLIATAARLCGGQSALARALGVRKQAAHRWIVGMSPLPPPRCVQIERITSGVITADRLRPDLRWCRVPDADWPHEAGRPTLELS